MIQLLIWCTKIMRITFDSQDKLLSQILLLVLNAIIGNNVLVFQSRTRKCSWKDEVGHNKTQTNQRSDYKRDSWDKILRNTKYSFICMSVVRYRNFKAWLISLSRDLFPAQDANSACQMTDGARNLWGNTSPHHPLPSFPANWYQVFRY